MGGTMDTSHLATQVTAIIGQLHGLFDDIGVPPHERESRETKLFTALSETLNGQLRAVSAEKDELTTEARRIIKTIRQMEASLTDEKPRDSSYEVEDERLRVTVPLTKCINRLKEEYNGIAKLHRERFEQVKKLVEALESYSSHLEPSFLRVQLPPTSANAQVPPTFDLSPSYIASLDEEFGRVYEEYVRRLETVKSLSETIVNLWSELGTPQAQTESTIVKHYRDSPEQLGLHASDIQRLQGKHDKLSQEKANREKKLVEMKTQIEALWDRLSVEDMDRKRFLAGTRGCGLRVINDFEAELDRLTELKRQNLGLFVEDARCRLQDLWDTLYFSEEEMLQFTPAFSDVYSDALLSSHEAEIERLTNLKEQRLPMLQMIEKHRSLINDRDELNASSQDASRLIAKKGERRDPGKLLREEKLRKRIAKELPKLEVELKKKLENWENDFGMPFLVHGQDYLFEIESMAEAAKPAPARSKTPGVTGVPPPRAKTPAPAKSAAKPAAKATPGPVRPKTPGATTARPAAAPRAVAPSAGRTSPSKIPARVPLCTMKNGNNSPERRQPPPQAAAQPPCDSNTVRKMGPPARAPPPKMRDLYPPTAPAARAPPAHAPNTHHYAQSETESERWRSDSAASSQTGSVVRHVDHDDPYFDHHSRAEKMSYAPPSLTSGTSVSSHSSQYSYGEMRSTPQTYHDLRPQSRNGPSGYPHAMQTQYSQFRQVSGDSTNSHPVSGSENWETYDDMSEVGEHRGYDADQEYYAKLRAAQSRGKRFTPEGGYDNTTIGKSKKMRSVYEGLEKERTYVQDEQGRLVSASDAGWTDEDGAF